MVVNVTEPALPVVVTWSVNTVLEWTVVGVDVGARLDDDRPAQTGQGLAGGAGSRWTPLRRPKPRSNWRRCR